MHVKTDRQKEQKLRQKTMSHPATSSLLNHTAHYLKTYLCDVAKSGAVLRYVIGFCAVRE